MVIRHTNRGHFRHFKVASRSLPFCAPSSSKIWFPVSPKTKGGSAIRRGRERGEGPGEGNNTKSGNGKEAGEQPVGNCRPRPHTVDHI